MNELAATLSQWLRKEDPEIEFRIKTGTEMYRKGFGRIELRKADGSMVKQASIRLKQKSHEYLFGCNAFMLNQFPEEEQNRRYEEMFAGLFNEAVVPFYWSDLEVEDGHPRFASGSAPIYRRPPPDEVVAFCKRNAITPKGHPLCWQGFVPEWAPKTYTEMMKRLDRRIREIAERYGNDIPIWDTVNEAQSRHPIQRGFNGPAFPDNHVEEVFKMAERHLPLSTLLYNDDNKWWLDNGDYSPVYLLVKTLQEHGCRVGGLGLQFHMFSWLLDQAKFFLNPRQLYRCLDQYAKLNIPVNFSEVSIISRRDLGDGDAFQEFVTEKLYRLWFSHPATNSIVWWNLVDGTAAYAPLGSEDGENSLRAGLINYDFSPKPAYRVLERLIKKEWHTETALDYQEEAENVFHGFYGKYQAEIETEDGTFSREIFLSRDSDNMFRIFLN